MWGSDGLPAGAGERDEELNPIGAAAPAPVSTSSLTRRRTAGGHLSVLAVSGEK